jgi:hypothetical protein
MKTVVGLFDTYAHAEIAAHDLERVGISHADISLLANNTAAQLVPADAETTHPTHHLDAETEAEKGAVAGGVAGLLLGLAALAIPGLGAVAAAGWLATTVAGAVVGAGVGIVGALNGVGVPHEDAVTYNEGLRRGGALLAVRTEDDQATKVAEILSADGAVNISERAEQYRQEGFAPSNSMDQERDQEPETTSAVSEERVESDPYEAEQGDAPVYQLVEEAPIEVVVLVEEEFVEVEPQPPAPPAFDANASAPTSDLEFPIRRRAYELYEQRGHRDGHALDDWLDAERELRNNGVGRAYAMATPVSSI